MVEDPDKQTDIAKELVYEEKDLDISNSFLVSKTKAKTDRRLSFAKT